MSVEFIALSLSLCFAPWWDNRALFFKCYNLITVNKTIQIYTWILNSFSGSESEPLSGRSWPTLCVCLYVFIEEEQSTIQGKSPEICWRVFFNFKMLCHIKWRKLYLYTVCGFVLKDKPLKNNKTKRSKILLIFTLSTSDYFLFCSHVR